MEAGRVVLCLYNDRRKRWVKQAIVSLLSREAGRSSVVTCVIFLLLFRVLLVFVIDVLGA